MEVETVHELSLLRINIYKQTLIWLYFCCLFLLQKLVKINNYKKNKYGTGTHSSKLKSK